MRTISAEVSLSDDVPLTSLWRARNGFQVFTPFSCHYGVHQAKTVAATNYTTSKGIEPRELSRLQGLMTINVYWRKKSAAFTSSEGRTLHNYSLFLPVKWHRCSGASTGCRDLWECKHLAWKGLYIYINGGEQSFIKTPSICKRHRFSLAPAKRQGLMRI